MQCCRWLSHPASYPFRSAQRDSPDKNSHFSFLTLARSDTRRVCYFVGGLSGSQGESLAFRTLSWHACMLAQELGSRPLSAREFVLSDAGFSLTYRLHCMDDWRAERSDERTWEVETLQWLLPSFEGSRSLKTLARQPLHHSDKSAFATPNCQSASATPTSQSGATVGVRNICENNCICTCLQGV